MEKSLFSSGFCRLISLRDRNKKNVMLTAVDIDFYRATLLSDSLPKHFLNKFSGIFHALFFANYLKFSLDFNFRSIIRNAYFYF
jgi:hypothetical protein